VERREPDPNLRMPAGLEVYPPLPLPFLHRQRRVADQLQQRIRAIQDRVPVGVDARVGVVDDDLLDVLTIEQAQRRAGPAGIWLDVDSAFPTVQSDQVTDHTRQDLLAAGVAQGAE